MSEDSNDYEDLPLPVVESMLECLPSQCRDIHSFVASLAQDYFPSSATVFEAQALQLEQVWLGQSTL